MLVKREIFFDEASHKYTDSFKNPYVSTTTLISKYYEGFKTIEIAEACEKIGRGLTKLGTRHPKYLKYKGKTANQLLHEWDITRDTACAKGSTKHNYLEDTIKSVNNYNKIKYKYINNRIYTLDEIIDNDNIGKIDISLFDNLEFKNKYPSIYNFVRHLISEGWSFYAELGIYDPNVLISGLIDLFAIKGTEFLIIDWKTNAQPIRFDAGYYEKDNNGNYTDTYINKFDKFYSPLEHLDASTGNKYAMQLSTYAYMAELRGLTCIGLILYHIRDVEENGIVNEVVTPLQMPYLKDEVSLMFKDHSSRLNLKSQYQLF